MSKIRLLPIAAALTIAGGSLIACGPRNEPAKTEAEAEAAQTGDAVQSETAQAGEKIEAAADKAAAEIKEGASEAKQNIEEGADKVREESAEAKRDADATTR